MLAISNNYKPFKANLRSLLSFLFVVWLIYIYSIPLFEMRILWLREGISPSIFFFFFAICWAIHNFRSEPSSTLSPVIGYVFLAEGISCMILGTILANFWISQLSFIISLYGLFITFKGWNHGKKLVLPLGLMALSVPIPLTVMQFIMNKLQLLCVHFTVIFFNIAGIATYHDSSIFDLGSISFSQNDIHALFGGLIPYICISYILIFSRRQTLGKKVFLLSAIIPIIIVISSIFLFILEFLANKFNYIVSPANIIEEASFNVFFISITVFIFLLFTTDKDLTKFSLIAFIGKIKILPQKSLQSHIGLSVFSSIIITLLLTVASFAPATIKSIVERNTPFHLDFSHFPDRLGSWTCTRSQLTNTELKSLNLTDYLLLNCNRPNGSTVGLYVAYYAAQIQGSSIHSPKTCLQGAGWATVSHKVLTINLKNGHSLKINRDVLRSVNNKMLVYYWFKQGDINVTSRFSEKITLLRNVVMSGRADGSLIRITAPIPIPTTPEAEKNLDNDFIDLLNAAYPSLTKYI
ncbi:exosortase C-terminal domain/associated protein EpsI [Desulfovibrio sp. UCD-KL4C]|uniref:exosortase C-terminal domain/associated protein EpsI n=1 Tax=Desulfovibrio sp. UCD-KL4C TaxID=2578120 RepID=UPI0025BA05A1|nr:exosortase C-terminal domain/associated protein EpsI [Desulfovibrio sp. UCD-KL4C]